MRSEVCINMRILTKYAIVVTNVLVHTLKKRYTDMYV